MVDKCIAIAICQIVLIMLFASAIDPATMMDESCFATFSRVRKAAVNGTDAVIK